jgi:hypothetical protein
VPPGGLEPGTSLSAKHFVTIRPHRLCKKQSPCSFYGCQSGYFPLNSRTSKIVGCSSPISMSLPRFHRSCTFFALFDHCSPVLHPPPLVYTDVQNQRASNCEPIRTDPWQQHVWETVGKDVSMNTDAMEKFSSQ